MLFPVTAFYQSDDKWKYSSNSAHVRVSTYFHVFNPVKPDIFWMIFWLYVNQWPFIMTHQNLKWQEGLQISRSPHKHPVAINPKKIIQIRSHMNFHVNSLRNKEGLCGALWIRWSLLVEESCSLTNASIGWYNVFSSDNQSAYLSRLIQWRKIFNRELMMIENYF